MAATVTATAKEILTYQDTNGNIVASISRTINGDGQSGFKEAFAAGSVNVPVAFAFIKTKAQSFVFTSDQPCTLKTNSSGTPQETITLAAGGIYAWNTAHTEVNPLVGDITALYVSVPGATAANVTGSVLSNLV